MLSFLSKKTPHCYRSWGPREARLRGNLGRSKQAVVSFAVAKRSKANFAPTLERVMGIAPLLRSLSRRLARLHLPPAAAGSCSIPPVLSKKHPRLRREGVFWSG